MILQSDGTAPPDPEESGTVILESPVRELADAKPDPEESGTVMLVAPVIDSNVDSGPDPEESGTVMLSR